MTKFIISSLGVVCARSFRGFFLHERGVMASLRRCSYSRPPPHVCFNLKIYHLGSHASQLNPPPFNPLISTISKCFIRSSLLSLPLCRRLGLQRQGPPVSGRIEAPPLLPLVPRIRTLIEGYRASTSIHFPRYPTESAENTHLFQLPHSTTKKHAASMVVSHESAYYEEAFTEH